jgi:hypothetical protein
MKRIILVSAIALLAACGSSDNGVSVGSETAQTAAPAADSAPPDSASATDATDTSVEGSDDTTITVDDFGDMPPQCIELLSTFLKQIEPTVSAIDWDTATLGDFEDFEDSFKTQSDAFDAETAAAGCDKYSLTGTDQTQLEQMSELAAAEAPGTLGFIKFLGALTTAATATAGDLPTDCAGSIAAIEPYLAKGGTMTDMTMADLTRFGQLMPTISSNCTAEEAAAFYARADLTAFIGDGT